MGLTAKSGGDFSPTPEGNHRMILVGLYDLGTQVFEGQYGSSSNQKVLFLFRLVDELRDDGTPHTISAEFTLSLADKSKLKPFLESWRGKPFTADELAAFELVGLLGKGCMGQVIHVPKRQGGGVYAQLKSVASMPKGMAAPTVDPAELVAYDLDRDGEPPEAFPAWIRRKIAGSVEGQRQGWIPPERPGQGNAPAGRPTAATAHAGAHGQPRYAPPADADDDIPY